MLRASIYRYFLCFLPTENVREEIGVLHTQTGQCDKCVPVGRAHLSLCVLCETAARDHSLAGRVDAALAGMQLPACVVRLGRVRGDARGATLYTRGSRAELTALRRGLMARLAVFGLVPELEKTNPHITLGYDPCGCPGFDLALEWIPDKIVLIESEHGLSRHNPLRSWSLLPPEQGVLPMPLLPRLTTAPLRLC